MSVHQKHPVTRKARKRYQVHFFLMCRWLWAAISVLVTEPGSSGWIVNVLKCWATLHLLSLFLIKKTYLDVRGVLTSSIHYYKPRGSFMTQDSLDIDSNDLLSMVVPILSMFSLTSLKFTLLGPKMPVILLVVSPCTLFWFQALESQSTDAPPRSMNSVEIAAK